MVFYIGFGSGWGYQELRVIDTLLAVQDTHEMLMTVVAAVAFGALLLVVARRLHLPAIVVLLVGGVALGPAVLGDRALINPEGLGSGLVVIVSLAIGIILFESGLTLELTGYRSAPGMIKRLLTIGVLVTWFGTALIVRFVIGEAWDTAIIAGSLVIVTGPTVIGPLLKRIKVTQRLHSILHWEGVLIDPLGVFIVLLCYEWVSGETQVALYNFLARVAWGTAVGAAGGLLAALMIRRSLIPDDIVNVFALGSAVLTFGLAEYVIPESGLLAVTVAGFVFGLTGTTRLKQVRQFKAELTDLLIGTLFMLLAARLEIRDFQEFGAAGLLSVGLVIFVVRPLSISLCSVGTDLGVRERVFLSWVAPRGIVAASMASLIAINLGDRFVETLTYTVIVSTIILQGTTAGSLARLLGLRRKEPTGWMIVGAHAFARQLAEFLSRAAKVHVVLVDTNSRAVRDAKALSLHAITADARDASLLDRYDFQGVGNILALTDNEDLNVRVCESWRDAIGRDHVFRATLAALAAGAGQRREAPAGTTLWPRLPRPTLVAAEMERGESVILADRRDDLARSHVAIPLFAIQNDRITVDARQFRPEARVLYLYRKADHLLRAILPELILTLHARDIGDLITQMVDQVVRIEPAIPRDQVLEEILERERAFPTLLGYGIAAPHAIIPTLKARRCAVARVPEGVSFSMRPGEERADLVFLLLSPQGDPEGHLAALAELARAVIKPEVRERLRAANTPDAVIAALREFLV